MQHIWRFIYLCWAVVCLAGGYRALAPERTAYFEEVPRSFVVVLVLFWCIAPLAITALNSCFFGAEMTFRRPSLDRSPFGGGRDTLQGLRLCLVSAVFALVGACFALPKADHEGVILFWATTAMIIAFFIGERLVYWVYAKRIAKSAEQPARNL